MSDTPRAPGLPSAREAAHELFHQANAAGHVVPLCYLAANGKCGWFCGALVAFIEARDAAHQAVSGEALALLGDGALDGFPGALIVLGRCSRLIASASDNPVLDDIDTLEQRIRAFLGDGVGLSFNITIWPILAFYVHLHGGWAARLARWLLPNQKRDHAGRFVTDYGDRQIWIYVHDWALWWQLWQDPNEWSSRTPRWRHGAFHLVDFLFGRTKYTERELAREQVKIPMPERAYDGEVVIEERIWRRPRWPFVWHRRVGATVHCERDPIPHPGKGTTDYNCGEDATYSSSSGAETVEAAVAELVQSSLEQRRRYGGPDWVPQEDHRPKNPPDLRVAK